MFAFKNLFQAGSATIPGAPTILSATAGVESVTVVFDPPTFNGGLPITSYTVTASPGGTTASSASTSIVVSGLTAGQSYTFTVTATNAIGTGPSSNPSSSATPTEPGDPYWSSVGALFHFNGNFTDSSGNCSLSDQGGCDIATSTVKYGSGSLRYGSYASFSAPSAVRFGTGDFTIEFWLYVGSNAYTEAAFVTIGDPRTSGGWSVFTDNGRGVLLYANSGYVTSGNSSCVPNTNAWNFYAITRQGTTLRVYKNGSLAETGSTSLNFDGAYMEMGRLWNGNTYQPNTSYRLDELRLTKGVARYTGSTMTVPSAAFKDY